MRVVKVDVDTVWQIISSFVTCAFVEGVYSWFFYRGIIITGIRSDSTGISGQSQAINNSYSEKINLSDGVLFFYRTGAGEFVAWNTFYLYIARLTKDGNASNYWRISSAVIFESGSTFQVETIKTDGKCR